MNSRRVTLVVAGRDDGDYERALREALRLIKLGYSSGHCSAQDSSSGFYFGSADDLADGELPAGVTED